MNKLFIGAHNMPPGTPQLEYIEVAAQAGYYGLGSARTHPAAGPLLGNRHASNPSLAIRH
jgi:hypothetical protein